MDDLYSLSNYFINLDCWNIIFLFHAFFTNYWICWTNRNAKSSSNWTTVTCLRIWTISWKYCLTNHSIPRLTTDSISRHSLACKYRRSQSIWGMVGNNSRSGDGNYLCHCWIHMTLCDDWCILHEKLQQSLKIIHFLILTQYDSITNHLHHLKSKESRIPREVSRISGSSKETGSRWTSVPRPEGSCRTQGATSVQKSLNSSSCRRCCARIPGTWKTSWNIYQIFYYWDSVWIHLSTSR